jgi:hypothetical protein
MATQLTHVVDRQALVSALRSPSGDRFTHAIVAVSIDGAEPELQINPRSNWLAKADYFAAAYNDDLTMIDRLQSRPPIRVTDFCFTTDLPATLAEWQPRGTGPKIKLGKATDVLNTKEVIEWCEANFDASARTDCLRDFVEAIRDGDFNVTALLHDHTGGVAAYVVNDRTYYADATTPSNSPQSGTIGHFSKGKDCF